MESQLLRMSRYDLQIPEDLDGFANHAKIVSSCLSKTCPTSRLTGSLEASWVHFLP